MFIPSDSLSQDLENNSNGFQQMKAKELCFIGAVVYNS